MMINRINDDVQSANIREDNECVSDGFTSTKSKRKNERELSYAIFGSKVSKLRTI